MPISRPEKGETRRQRNVLDTYAVKTEHQHDHLPVKAEEVLGAQESHQQQTNSANDETLRRRSAKGKSSDYTIQSQQ
jgi:hypothetical protein